LTLVCRAAYSGPAYLSRAKPGRFVITIIDYGSGNLLSVATAFRRLGAEITVSCQPADVLAAERIVLPGVGSLADGMNRLRETGVAGALERKVVQQRTPILGICLGMQMFSRRSEEGDAPGFGWIEAETRRFAPPADSPLKVPHMGWNEVRLARPHAIVRQVPSGACFYFAHSYHVVCDDPADVLATTDFGGEFTSAVQREHVFGFQFHPEKSHELGAQLIRNFLDYRE
jgi:glutamine amidotransferase